MAHVESAHTDAQLGILLEQDQGVLDIEMPARTQSIDGIADWRTGTLIRIQCKKALSDSE
ncbi:hypothetical protein OKHIL_22190 [Mycolicibacterium mageritense]